MSKDGPEIIHQTLFACTECGARHKFVDLSPEEQLCKECRRKYPLRNCAYCQMEFYWMGSLEASPVCKRCKRDHHVHGKPVHCCYCKLKAAFSGGKCFRCQYFEAKYNTPVECNMCKTRCAFIKSEESRKKVQGKTLCYLCTLKLKKTLYRDKKRATENGCSPEDSKDKKFKVSDSLSSDIFQELDSKVEVKGTTPTEVDQLPGLGDLPSRDQQMVIETLQSENMFRIEELKDEIASLKRQIHLKDQTLHEKEKDIHNLKAEIWEQEKDFKLKLSHSQIASDEKILEFQETIADLKKQLAKASKGANMSENHGSVSQGDQSDTSLNENNPIFSYEQSPTILSPSAMFRLQKPSASDNDIVPTPHIKIELGYTGNTAGEIKQEVEDSSVFLSCTDKQCIIGLENGNELDSSDSGDHSESEKVTPIGSAGTKILQVMECPQFIHRNNDVLDTNQVPQSGLVDRPPQPQLTATDGDITVVLANSDMWSQFDAYGTEMVLTKRGRRMFPYIEVNIRSGLDLDKDYILLMDMNPFDDHRYKFHDGNWIPSMKADPPPVSMMYIHSDSPQKGSFWLSHTISFRKLKLTNCDSRKGHILLNTQHKYTPRLHIVQGSDTNNITGPSLRTFTFPHTSFVTVSTYKNFQITQLKVDNNPFAKHFRNSYHTTKRVMKIAEIEGFANASSNQYTPQTNMDTFQKHTQLFKHNVSTPNNSISIDSMATTKTHTLLHVDPTQTYTYTTSNSPEAQILHTNTHFINEQPPILTMMHNGKGYALNTVPSKQGNIFFQGSHQPRRSPTQEGSDTKRMKLDTSPVQLHPPSPFISIAQPSQMISQGLGIQTSTGSIQIITNGNTPSTPQVPDLQQVFTTVPQPQDCIITQTGIQRRNSKPNQSPPGVQIIQNRPQGPIISYNPVMTPNLSQNNSHSPSHINDSLKSSQSDQPTDQPIYSLPNGTGSYMMAYLPILLPCNKSNDPNGTPNETVPHNIPILGSLPPGINFHPSSIASAVLPTNPASQTP